MPGDSRRDGVDQGPVAGLKSGDIHRVRFGPAQGHTQAGTRPAVILQANGLMGLSTVILAPLSRSARGTSFRPRVLMDDIPSRVLVEQMTAVDVRQVGTRLGTVSADEHVEIDQALRLVLGMR